LGVQRQSRLGEVGHLVVGRDRRCSRNRTRYQQG
jgi:hypothetical protein